MSNLKKMFKGDKFPCNCHVIKGHLSDIVKAHDQVDDLAEEFKDLFKEVIEMKLKGDPISIPIIEAGRLMQEMDVKSKESAAIHEEADPVTAELNLKRHFEYLTNWIQLMKKNNEEFKHKIHK